MSLFNLFKKKETSTSKEPHYYDIEDILRVPKNERDIIWRQKFLTSLLKTPLYSGQPGIVKNPEGLEYTNLTTIASQKGIEPSSLTDYISLNLSNGYGIVLNGNKELSDWAFSYGDIVDFSINQEFYSGKIKAPFGSGYVIDKYVLKQEARVGQPSELYLPNQARIVIRKFLNSFGIDPKICLILWVQTNQLSLAFNIVPEMFENSDEAAFQSFLNFLGWFLPRHYQIVSMTEDESFKPL
jgi:hypothetical protein